MSVTVGSLFSGIDGLSLGAERAGCGPTRWQVEIDPYARSILEKHWPEAKRYDDVRHVGKHNLEPVDLIVGGFPCQDVSSAGKGKGLSGARSGLWREYRRILEEIAPTYAIVENVASGARRWLPYVRRDLHLLGYRTRALALSAFDVGAPHLRRRVFVVAADPKRVELRDEPRWCGGANGKSPCEPANDGASRTAPDRQWELQPSGGKSSRWRWSRHCDSGDAPDTVREGLEERGEQLTRDERKTSERGDPSRIIWAIEPGICGVAHGVPNRVDRLKCLGNAVVPDNAEVATAFLLRETRRKTQ